MAVTDVAAPLPDLVLEPGSTITVELDDASAIVTQLNVYGFTPDAATGGTLPVLPPLFVYGPEAA